jgi:hypothetical protein
MLPRHLHVIAGAGTGRQTLHVSPLQAWHPGCDNLHPALRVDRQ